jgi:hypothetical protein
MDAEDFAEIVAEALRAQEASVKSFADAGIMGGDDGLVVKIDGSEFQVSIVKVVSR